MTNQFEMIPVIEISPQFGTDSDARARMDDAIGRACREVGFLIITGQPAGARLDYAAQKRSLAFFDLPGDVKRGLARYQNNPANCNIYRGPMRVRHSIPYFFEPRFDTVIECLPCQLSRASVLSLATAR